ncbi:MAG: ATP-binding protein [Chloroflexi bacterium]|nr:ATP-binding protein [Chloroflexota bacterium]
MAFDTFLDREKELAFLEREYRAAGGRFVVIYGRRRVGKSRLITEFIRDKPHFYYQADARLDLVQRRAVRDQLLDERPAIRTLSRESEPPDWSVLLYHIADQDPSRKLVVVLDEFQYLVQGEPAFPSLLQKLWDADWEHRNLLLILCGSHEGMVHDAVLAYDSPLYGRRTGQIRLLPFSFTDYWRVFDHPSFNAAVENYAVSGGVPRYIAALGLEGPLWDRVRTQILDPHAILHQEPRFVLSADRVDVPSYFSILEAVAAGHRRRTKIANAIGQPIVRLSPYLARLVDLGLLERRVPLTEQQKSRLGLYYLSDPFFCFWFRFVLPGLTQIGLGQIDAVLHRIQEGFGGHVALQFEDACLAWVTERAARGGWPFPLERIGRWWGGYASGSVEIDILGLNDSTGDMLLGECKWVRQPVGIDVLHALYDKSLQVPWRLKDHRRPRFAIFSRSGFHPDLLARAARPNASGWRDVLLVHDGRVVQDCE